MWECNCDRDDSPKSVGLYEVREIAAFVDICVLFCFCGYLPSCQCELLKSRSVDSFGCSHYASLPLNEGLLRFISQSTASATFDCLLGWSQTTHSNSYSIYWRGIWCSINWNMSLSIFRIASRFSWTNSLPNYWQKEVLHLLIQKN